MRRLVLAALALCALAAAWAVHDLNRTLTRAVRLGGEPE